MPTITVKTIIHSTPEVCFDAARDIDLHVVTTSGTEERAVGGRTSGLIGFGEQVTWEARHFGIRQRFTAEITAFDRPRYSQDTMRKGAFHSFVHDHYFEAVQDGTMMTDVVTFQSPLGFLGTFVDRFLMADYLRRFLTKRNQALKEAVEGGRWKSDRV